MSDLGKPFDQKYVQSQSTRELVHNPLEGTGSATGFIQTAIENSWCRPSTERLNLDSEPTGNRVRECF
jgi:hypothetical protein